MRGAAEVRSEESYYRGKNPGFGAIVLFIPSKKELGKSRGAAQFVRPARKRTSLRCRLGVTTIQEAADLISIGESSTRVLGKFILVRRQAVLL